MNVRRSPVLQPRIVPPLDTSEVHVWTLPSAIYAAAGDALHALLDPAEVARADRFRFERNRALYVIGRAAARSLISAYSGDDPATVRFLAGKHGKPELAPECAPLHVNWSHSGDLVVFAISRCARVGVDVERVGRFANIDDIAARVFSPRELEEFRAHEGEARRLAFFNGWTRKEAFIKATGEGMTRPLKGFDVALTHPPALRAIAGSEEAARRWTLHSFTPGEGYTAAVVVGAPGVSLRVLSWS